MTIEVGLLKDDVSLAAHVAMSSIILLFFGVGLALNWTVSSYLGIII